MTLKKSAIDIIGKNNFIVNKLNPGDVQFHHCLTVQEVIKMNQYIPEM